MIAKKQCIIQGYLRIEWKQAERCKCITGFRPRADRDMDLDFGVQGLGLGDNDLYFWLLDSVYS